MNILDEIYRISSIADLHWGALSPERLLYELELFIEHIKEYRPHLVVIPGDYWDYKVSLNSKVAIFGINWMHELKALSIELSFVTRMLKGTKSHDEDQLDVFNNLDDGSTFRIFRENTLEETLPGLWCIYCPDENIKTDDYIIKYADNIINDTYKDIGFFHGNFDIIIEKITNQETEVQSISNVIFEYNFWKTIVNGPMIAGHWHTHKEMDRLWYISSYSRFGFNEEEDKGWMTIDYDTSNKTFKTNFIVNDRAKKYITFTINTMISTNIDSYSALLNMIKVQLEKDDDMKIRIKVDITDEKPENDRYISFVKNFFADSKRVSVVIKNKLAEKLKKIKKKEKEESLQKFDYIDDTTLSEAKKIQQYILMTKGIEVPLDIIEEYSTRALEKMKAAKENTNI